MGGLADQLARGSWNEASVTRWRGFYGHSNSSAHITFQNASTECRSTVGSGANITICNSAKGKCAVHAYAGSATPSSNYAAPAEVRTTEQMLNFFAAQGPRSDVQNFYL